MKRKFIILVLIILFLCAFLILFLMNKNKEKGYLTLFGNIEIRQSDLSFRVPGRLKKLYVEEGDFVKEGTILAELESDIYQKKSGKTQKNFNF